MNYSCVDLGNHELVTCRQYLPGGIGHLALLDPDEHGITDWDSTAQWQAGIADGKIALILGVKAELPEASAVNAENPVPYGPQEILDLWTWVLNVTDAQWRTENHSFWETANVRDNHLVIVHTDANGAATQLSVVDNALVHVGMRPMVPATRREFRKYSGTMTWEGFYFPRIEPAPANIFVIPAE